MSLTLAELYASPAHYLHAFADGAAVFVPMDAAAYRASVFLDDRIRPAGKGAMRVPLDMLLGHAPPPPDTTWIFHVAHCGSTLLANAIEALGGGLVLREPLALRQLALGEPLHEPALDVTLAMLAKRFDTGLPTLVKANVPVNFILDAIAARQPQARAILLWLGLEDYLAAILRSDNHRSWLRNVSSELALRLGDPAGLSDAVLAARLWLGHSHAFARALEAMPHAAVLDAEHFFARPGEVLAAAARHLAIPAAPEAVSALVAGELFTTYSKRPGIAFSNAERLARRDAARSEIAAEIAAAQDWLNGAGCDTDAISAVLKARLLAI